MFLDCDKNLDLLVVSTAEQIENRRMVFLGSGASSTSITSGMFLDCDQNLNLSVVSKAEQTENR